jgi:hypothetical protein
MSMGERHEHWSTSCEYEGSTHPHYTAYEYAMRILGKYAIRI